MRLYKSSIMELLSLCFVLSIKKRVNILVVHKYIDNIAACVRKSKQQLLNLYNLLVSACVYFVSIA